MSIKKIKNIDHSKHDVVYYDTSCFRYYWCRDCKMTIGMKMLC